MIKKSVSKKSSTSSKPKSSKLGEDILQGLEEGLSHVRGQIKLRARTVQIPHDVDISQLRQKYGLSQSQFAAKFGLNPRTLQDWECGRARPETAVRAYLRVIDRNPTAVEEALRDSY